MIYNVPSFIEFGTAAGRAVRFLIFDAPTDGNALKYLEVKLGIFLCFSQRSDYVNLVSESLQC